MNIAFLLLLTLPIFVGSYFIYGNYIAGKMGLDDARRTPAVAINDKVDYVPTKAPVIFAHHFSAIAGPGRSSGRPSRCSTDICRFGCGS